MVISEDYEGKSEDNPKLERGSTPANQTVSTRKGGIQTMSNSDHKQKILVDMREFRSELPSLIHRRGIDIIPITIEVSCMYLLFKVHIIVV